MKKILGFGVILIAVLLPHFLPLPFNTYSILIIGIIWLYLKIDGRKFTDIGFSIPQFKPQTLLYGILAAVLIISFLQLVFFPIIESFITFAVTPVEMYDKLNGNLWYSIICHGTYNTIIITLLYLNYIRYKISQLAICK